MELRTVRSRVGVVLLLAGAMIWGCGSLQAGQRWETLEAIHWIENPSNSTKPGPHGELGAYQFRECTWRMHTAEPFACALRRADSDMVAVAHYEWIKRGLERAGLAVTTYNVALAWNGGLTATVTGHAPAASRDYAERVTNIADEIRRRVASEN